MDMLSEAENIINYKLSDPTHEKDICRLGRALSVPDRLQILRVLQDKPYSVIEISSMLGLPVSSVSFHVKVLEEAKLIRIEYKPAQKGHMKLCSLGTILSTVFFTKVKETVEDEIKVELPVGCYSECKVSKAYMADGKGFIGKTLPLICSLRLKESKASFFPSNQVSLPIISPICLFSTATAEGYHSRSSAVPRRPITAKIGQAILPYGSTA